MRERKGKGRSRIRDDMFINLEMNSWQGKANLLWEGSVHFAVTSRKSGNKPLHYSRIGNHVEDWEWPEG
jgi:hypothetical protein